MTKYKIENIISQLRCPSCTAVIEQESPIAICSDCNIVYHANCARCHDYKCVMCGSGNLIVQPGRTRIVVSGASSQDVKSVAGSLLGRSQSKKPVPKDKESMVRILFLASNPTDTNRLRLDKEVRAISERLRQAELRDVFDLRQEWAVRVGDLQGHLLHYKPEVVHFSGHGSRVSEIILEDSFGDSHLLSVRALSRLFSMFKDDIRCVVLNACYSEQQAQAIAQNIDCVIGMSKAITGSAAISFAAAFYQALGYGKDIRSAFELGCIQIDLENLDEQDTPKLIALIRPPETITLLSKASQANSSDSESSVDSAQVKVLDSKQEKVRVYVVIVSTGRSYVAEMPVDMVVKYAVHRLVESLSLPLRFETGAPVKYSLFSKSQGRKLDDDLTLRQNQVQNDEVLGLHVEMLAG